MLALKKYISVFVALIIAGISMAQELYIFTDPASNIPAHALSLRVNNMLMPMADVMGGQVDRTSYRLSLDAAYGINKNLMVKLSGYGSDMFQPQFKAEGAALSAKYRFYSNDDFHKHFRMAGFGKIAYSNNPRFMQTTVVHQYPDGPHTETMLHDADELHLDGNHSGWQVGLVGTQLVHKLALSGTLSYIGRINNTKMLVTPELAQSGMQYAVSAGYLLFPRNYDNYGQTNINLYAELIGQSALDKYGSFLDFAPAVQLILNSKARIDLAYRFQLNGTMSRFNEKLWLLRFEYNFLQAFRK
jgi:hypothetical protein